MTEFLDTRLPDELEHYRTAVLATDVITRRAFSNEVITPGKTTVGDVRWWMMQQLNNIGVDNLVPAGSARSAPTKEHRTRPHFLMSPRKLLF